VNASDPIGIDVYDIDDVVNFSINASTGVITNNTVLLPGVYTINVSVNDTEGNVLWQVITVTVTDSADPVVVLVSPVNGENFSVRDISLTCNATNLNLSNITLYTNTSGTWAANETVGASGSLRDVLICSCSSKANTSPNAL